MSSKKLVHLVVGKFAWHADDRAKRLANFAHRDLKHLGEVTITTVPAGDEIWVLAYPQDQRNLDAIRMWIAGLEAGKAL